MTDPRDPGDTLPIQHLSVTDRLRVARNSRAKAITSLRARLQLRSFPRIQMALIVALTGATGLLWSFLLYQAGVDSMAMRYPLALIGAYFVFLFLLWLWLRTNASDYSSVDGSNLPDFGDAPSDGGGHVPQLRSGGGGDFGGGGADVNFDATGSLLSHSPGSVSDAPSLGDGLGNAAGDALGGLDELAVPIIAVLLALGLALASLYVVYVAPELFAEILFDGTLSYTLYRRLRKNDSPHWLTSAVTRTVWPFLITAVFLMFVGAALTAYAPGAHTLSEAFHYVKPASAMSKHVSPRGK
jgi:hypothetical protein